MDSMIVCSLRRGMEKDSSSHRGNTATPVSRHPRIGDTPPQSGRPVRCAAHSLTPHVRPDDRRLHPERIRTPRIAAVARRPARSDLHTVRGLHELRSAGGVTAPHRIHHRRPFRWVVRTLTDQTALCLVSLHTRT